MCYDEVFTWQLAAVVAIIIIMDVVTYLTNDGFNGYLKFKKNQQEQITISRDEFDTLSRILIKELKDEISREASL